MYALLSVSGLFLYTGPSKKKECLFRMTIGSEKVKDLQYISDQKLEVTVPTSVKPGLLFLNIQSGGGTARSVILVKNAD